MAVKRSNREIIARLDTFASRASTPDFGSPSAPRIRKALGELVDAGAVIREGVKRTTTYRLAS